MKRYVPIPSQLIILKLQSRPFSGSRLSWLHAYFNSNVEKHAVSCASSVFNFCWIVSIKLSIFGKWYLFLWIDLFNIFKSKASLTVLSLFTVITMGEIKFLSEQLFNFMMCSSASIFLSSALTSGCKLIITLRLFLICRSKISMKHRFNWVFYWSTDSWDKTWKIKCYLFLH